MEKNKVNVLWKSFLSLFIIVSCFSSTSAIRTIQAMSEFSMSEHVQLNEDKTSALIQLEASDGYSVVNIENPDGSKQDLINNKGFIVTENRSYTFTVTYVEQGKDTQQVYDKTVVVDQLHKEKTTGKQKNTPIQTPKVSDGGVTLNLVGYDDTTGLSNTDIMNVEVNVNFANDNTTSDKKVVFELPEGLRFIQIPVAGQYDTVGVDTKIIAKFDPTDPLATAIKSVKLPIMQSPIGNTFGKVEYALDSGTKSVTLSFKIRVDNVRYYKAMQIPKPIRATATKGVSAELIGNVQQNVKAYGITLGSGDLRYQDAGDESKEIMVSTPASKDIGTSSSHSLHLGINNSPLDFTSRYVKSVTYYIYYPLGMKYESLVNPWGASNSNIVDEPTNSRLKVVIPSWSSQGAYRVRYTAPVGLSDGEYQSPELDYAEIEYYDGTKETRTSSGIKHKVRVVSSSINKVDLSFIASAHYDESISENHFKTGPFFRLGNFTSAGMKTNQVIHFEVGTNWETRFVNLPFDNLNPTIGNTIKDIQYKTNKNSSWRSHSITSAASLPSLTNELKQLTGQAVGLDNDEYFVEVRANVGAFRPSFLSGTIGGPKSYINITTYGKLKPGIASETVKVSVYAADDEAATKVSAIGTVYNNASMQKTTASQSVMEYHNVLGVPITQITGGDRFKIVSTIGMNVYPYGTVNAVRAPEIYLRQETGTTIDIASFIVKTERGVVINDWTYTTHVNDFEETIYTIHTPESTEIGSYFDADRKDNKYLNIAYSIDTVSTKSGTFEARELIGWGKPGLAALADVGAAIHPIIDKFDMNGNGNTTERMLTVSTKQLNVLENKTMHVETFLSLDGEEPKGAYVEGNDDTVAFFTPGTDANYTVKTTNYSDKPTSQFDIYIPIPKAGTSFGTNFQKEDFLWDMTVSTPVQLDQSLASQFEVLYSTDATASTYDSTASYTLTPPANLSDVKMVMIRAKVEIQPSSEATFHIPLKVDETFETASVESKIGKRNVYNPVYDIVSGELNATMPGTKVGTELSLAEIGGFVFLDKNGDGLYKAADDDSLIKDHEVELYKWNETTLLYEALLGEDNQPIKTKTNASGVYNFNYSVGMEAGNYAVKFVEKTGAEYEYTVKNTSDRTIDSDAVITGAQRGWVLNIDPTSPMAKTIGCGFLRYNPPIDLKVSIKGTPNTVKVGESLIVGTNIEPDFWESIKDSSTPYTWEIVGSASEKAKATLSDNGDGSVSITPAALVSGETTFELQVTIKDIYGNTKTSTIQMITIISSTVPAITTPIINAYVGDSFNAMAGVSAVDNSGTTILLVTSGVTANTVITHELLLDGSSKYAKAGTYEVLYAIKDSNGNQATQPRKVKVSDVPVVHAAGQQYVQGDPTILASVASRVDATWLKAEDVVGATPSEEHIAGPAITTSSNDSIRYSVSGPSSNFSEIGIYEVTYTATNIDGKASSKTVKVLVQDKHATEDKQYVLSANPFILENVEAKDITESTAKDVHHSAVSAFKIDKNNLGEIIDIREVTDTVSITSDSINKVKTATQQGGIFPLTYTIGSGSDRAEIEKDVFVKPLNGVEDGNYVLQANPFSMDNNAAAGLDDVQSRAKARSIAVEILRDVNQDIIGFATVTNTIAVNASELADIQQSDASGGIYPLTFTITDGITILSKTVQVFVQPIGAVSDFSATIYVGGRGFTIENAEAAQMDITKILTNSGASATKVERDSFGNESGYIDISANLRVDADDVRALQVATLQGGLFPVNMVVSEGGITVVKRIIIVVKGTQTPPPIITPEGDELAISASDNTITYEEAVVFSNKSALKVSNAKAYLVKSGLEMNVTVNEEELERIRTSKRTGGVYELTFSATSNSFMRAEPVKREVKVNITVLSESEHASRNTGGIETGDYRNVYVYILMMIITGAYFSLKRRKTN